MESKLIEKINQNYSMILNILKRFLKENFVKFEENSKNYKSFEKNLVNIKGKDIDKFINAFYLIFFYLFIIIINQFRNKNDDILNKLENVKVKINELIKENLNNKNKIVENINDSFYLIKHPKQCLFLLEMEKNNENMMNYVNLIETQINNHKYEMIESIYFLLSNVKINLY